MEKTTSPATATQNLHKLLSNERSEFQTYKNLLILSVAFLLQFTAFNGMQNLQSSLNTEANVGVNSSSIIYICLIISSIFFPHPMISICGLKWSLVLSQIPYVLFIAANYYPKPYLMYPTAALVGLSAATLWTSQGSYITELGALYATEKQLDKDAVMNKFFGIFFTFFQSCQIWGNMISYLVLTPESHTSLVQPGNNSNFSLSRTYDKCGAAFSEEEYQSAEIPNKIDRKTINILCIIYICIGICSIIALIVLLDQRRISARDRLSIMLHTSMKLLVSTAKHMRNIDQLLIIPMTIWSGLELTFIFAQFTQAYVSCAINPKYVGLIMIGFGICDSIGSFLFGQLVKRVGRAVCFGIATVISYAMIFTMFFWRPSINQVSVLFIVAGFWGLADSVWQSQTSALYGVLFTENNEAAFSNYRLWESFGFALFYILIPRTRTRTSLIILIIFLTIGILGYVLVEYRCQKRESSKKNRKASTMTQTINNQIQITRF